ncbi:MAG: AarF/UbiB family protein [Pseudomonadota bacterium]
MNKKNPSWIRRSGQWLAIIANYRLLEIIPASFIRFLLTPIFCLIRWCSSALSIDSNLSEAQRFRYALEAVGPVGIKLGQMLSTRYDLFSQQWIDELSLLQDRIAPFSSELARALIIQEIGKPIEHVFLDFSDTPLATASIAQIHTARLTTGESVVLKIVRPHIREQIEADFNLLEQGAKITQWHPFLRRLRLVQLIKDYRTIMLNELSLTREAQNMLHFAKDFANSDLLYVPKIYTDYCTDRLIVMERIFGIPIDDIETLEALGIERKKLSERGAMIFFTQVFRNNFFHADMHPGNILVDPTRIEFPRYIALDCAIVGQLSDQDRYVLALQLLAFMDQDYHRLARLMTRAGWVTRSLTQQEMQAFAQALEKVCQPIFAKPLSEIQFGKVLSELMGLARQFDLYLVPQLVLLEKTLLHVEGLGRRLYDELDIWSIGRPWLTHWIRSQYRPKALLKRARHAALEFEDLLERLSVKIHTSETSHNETSFVSISLQITWISVLFGVICGYDPQLGFLGWDAPLSSWSWWAIGLGFFLLHLKKQVQRRSLFS